MSGTADKVAKATKSSGSDGARTTDAAVNDASGVRCGHMAPYIFVFSLDQRSLL